MMISGKATREGTQRYKERHIKNCHSTFFHEVGELTLSSIGLGTLTPPLNEQIYNLLTKAVEESIRNGVNMIDSSISYAYEQAERRVGEGIRNLIESGEASRDELVICTKGGILPHPTKNRVEWFAQNYIEPSQFSIKKTDLVGTRYCIHPEYLQDQLDRSLDNLGVETIDIYYIHNPERQLSKFSPDVFYSKLRTAFEVMEDAVASGKIGAYGIATWEGSRLPRTARKYIDLARIKSVAQEAAGNKEDKLKFIQLPLNMIRLEPLLLPIQTINGKAVSMLEAASHLGIFPVASHSIHKGRIAQRIPEDIISAFDNNFLNDYQRGLQFTRSTPALASALVGMTKLEHIKQNLALKEVSSIEKKNFRNMTHSIEGALFFHYNFRLFSHYIKTIW